MTYEDTLVNIIDVNNDLLKLKCSEGCDNTEVKLIRNVLKEQVGNALLCKQSKSVKPQK